MRIPKLAGLLLAAVVLAAGAPARAELRVSELDVFLNDHEVTVHVVLLDAVPPEFHESLHSGIPAHVKLSIELWQFNRFSPDVRLARLTHERTLTYNVVTKEYKVTMVRGDGRAPHVTRDLRDAQRVLSEARGTKLVPATTLDPGEVYYVRVDAHTALNGDASWVARMSGTAARTSRVSDHRRLVRIR